MLYWSQDGMEVAMKKVTLADIAASCGVSINTVSHALKDKPDISEATKTLIRRTAEEMGYIGNSSASFLRSGVSKCIAVILGDISNPHFSILIKEIEVSARKEGYTCFVLNTEENEVLEREAIIAAIAKNVDGIILCPVQQTDSNVRFLMRSGVPFTLIGRYFEQLSTNYVVCDDTHSGYLAAEYMIHQHKKRTAIITTDPYVSSARERLAGIRDCYAQNGLSLCEEDIFCVPLSDERRGNLLERIREPEYDSAICFSDLLALELLSFTPDLSIISFDHIRSRFRMPWTFASVTSSKGKMSDYAVQILLSAISGAKEPTQIVLPTKIG